MLNPRSKGSSFILYCISPPDSHRLLLQSTGITMSERSDIVEPEKRKEELVLGSPLPSDREKVKPEVSPPLACDTASQEEEKRKSMSFFRSGTVTREAPRGFPLTGWTKSIRKPMLLLSGLGPLRVDW